MQTFLTCHSCNFIVAIIFWGSSLSTPWLTSIYHPNLVDISHWQIIHSLMWITTFGVWPSLGTMQTLTHRGGGGSGKLAYIKIWSPRDFSRMNPMGWWLCNYISIHEDTCLCNNNMANLIDKPAIVTKMKGTIIQYSPANFCAAGKQLWKDRSTVANQLSTCITTHPINTLHYCLRSL